MSDPESWISLERVYAKLADRAIRARNDLNARISSHVPKWQSPEYRREFNRKYYAKNRERILAAQRQYRLTGVWSLGKPATNLG